MKMNKSEKKSSFVGKFGFCCCCVELKFSKKVCCAILSSEWVSTVKKWTIVGVIKKIGGNFQRILKKKIESKFSKLLKKSFVRFSSFVWEKMNETLKMWVKWWRNCAQMNSKIYNLPNLCAVCDSYLNSKKVFKPSRLKKRQNTTFSNLSYF